MPEKGIGDYRYYLCPYGVIKTEELPPHWGLLYYENDKITKIQAAEMQSSDKRMDIFVMMSIMRREGLLCKTYNYRKNE